MRHVLFEEAAMTSENVPASQRIHASEPTWALYSPAAHASHLVPLGPVYPASHMHADIDLLPDADVLLPGQLSQAPEPGCSLYSPAAQSFVLLESAS